MNLPPPDAGPADWEPTQAIPAGVIDAAIAWAVKIEFNQPEPSLRAAFEAWLAAHPMHTAAWQRVQSLHTDFAALPTQLALDTLETAAAERGRNSLRRRRALKLLSLMSGTAALAWLGREQTPWQRLTADASTATGERRTLALADGTSVQLNTDSAVEVKLSGSQRLIVLTRGEILISTGTDAAAPARRPFWVDTPFGRLQALGTRFAVRLEPNAVQVSVDEGRVGLYPRAGGPGAIAAPEQSWRLSKAAAVRAAQPDFDPLAWADGVIVARHMRLADLLAELSRYRSGYLVCDTAIADLRVSGVYRTDDIDRTLEFLSRTAPVGVSYRTRFWITVYPADAPASRA